MNIVILPGKYPYEVMGVVTVVTVLVAIGSVAREAPAHGCGKSRD